MKTRPLYSSGFAALDRQVRWPIPRVVFTDGYAYGEEVSHEGVKESTLGRLTDYEGE